MKIASVISRLVRKYTKLKTMFFAVERMAAEDWKNITLSEIINSTPRNKAADVFVELRNYWWDYD